MSELEAETQHSAKRVASRLKISSGMLRRYALAYEEITSTVIKQHPRDGRQYSSEQVAALVRAKGYVNSNPGMSVDAALKLALGASKSDTVRPPELSQEARGGLNADAMQQAFSTALEPLLTELQALRVSNERMTNEVVELRRDLNSPLQDARALPSAPTTKEAPKADDGPLVRAARWLEARLRGRL